MLDRTLYIFLKAILPSFIILTVKCYIKRFTALPDSGKGRDTLGPRSPIFVFLDVPARARDDAGPDSPVEGNHISWCIFGAVGAGHWPLAAVRHHQSLRSHFNRALGVGTWRVDKRIISVLLSSANEPQSLDAAYFLNKSCWKEKCGIHGWRHSGRIPLLPRKVGSCVTNSLLDII